MIEKDYIKLILGDEYEIVRTIDYEFFLYVIFKKKSFCNPLNDERFNIVSHQGPLKIDKLSKKYEFLNIYDFLSQFSDNELFFPSNIEQTTSIEDITKNAILRKRINWEDFGSLIEFYQIPLNEIDIYSLNKRDVIEINVLNEKIKNIVIHFLTILGANYTITNNHFQISQNL